ncbi:hypothetical protein [Ferruginibacter albus]|uniref:hypothetical protein n=1 Tax=Ferruginibacter albus TaxID=2875540 RepID=UPI001CC635BF|nr:hypothetical protein [Ferruginibacter albus]UAY51730.1 hypothetical protein K9M53_14180 [Ferruginibacter albus]
MGESPLTEDSTFVVKESVIIDFICAAVFTAMAISALMYDNNIDSGNRLFIKSLGFCIIPAIWFLKRGIQNKTSFAINKTGIYFYKNFVTDWQHFKTAYVTQKEITGSVSDNFILVVEYYKDGESGFFKRTFPLSATQDKADEEIMAAINFFAKLSKGY